MRVVALFVFVVILRSEAGPIETQSELVQPQEHTTPYGFISAPIRNAFKSFLQSRIGDSGSDVEVKTNRNIIHVWLETLDMGLTLIIRLVALNLLTNFFAVEICHDVKSAVSDDYLVPEAPETVEKAFLGRPTLQSPAIKTTGKKRMWVQAENVPETSVALLETSLEGNESHGTKLPTHSTSFDSSPSAWRDTKSSLERFCHSKLYKLFYLFRYLTFWLYIVLFLASVIKATQVTLGSDETTDSLWKGYSDQLFGPIIV